MLHINIPSAFWLNPNEKKAQRIKKPTFLTQKATKHLKKLPNYGLRPKLASYSSKETL